MRTGECNLSFVSAEGSFLKVGCSASGKRMNLKVVRLVGHVGLPSAQSRFSKLSPSSENCHLIICGNHLQKTCIVVVLNFRIAIPARSTVLIVATHIEVGALDEDMPHQYM